MRPAVLNLRVKSLARGNILVLGSVAIAVWLSHPPDLRPNAWVMLPTIGCAAGLAETVRCMIGRKRWTLYHASVLLCCYMDLLALTLVLFFLLYPYFSGFTPAR